MPRIQNDTGGNAAAVDINHYIAHYKTACGRLLNNLHAKQPELFRLFAVPSRPSSRRLAPGALATAAAVTVASASVTTAVEGGPVRMTMSGAGSTSGGSGKQGREPESTNYQGR